MRVENLVGLSLQQVDITSVPDTHLTALYFMEIKKRHFFSIQHVETASGREPDTKLVVRQPLYHHNYSLVPDIEYRVVSCWMIGT